MKIDVLNTEAKKVSTLELNEEVFNAEYNEPLIHQVVVAQLANRRQGTKSTLARGEVRGGKAKPYRQKGTGRARQGSTRGPHMIKGGVAFAPKPRDFSKKVNKKMKVAAMRSALSQKVRDGQFIVIDSFAISEPKTKLVAAILKKLNAEKTTLLVMNGEVQDVLQAGNNIQNLAMTDATLLNLYDLVRVNKCIITKDAVQALTEVLA